VEDVKTDVTDCIAQSREVTLEDVDSTPWYKRTLQIFFRFFAPLM